MNRFFKGAVRVTLLLVVIVLVSTLLNLAVYTAFVLYYSSDEGSQHLSVRTYAAALTVDEGQYRYQEDTKALLDQYGAAAFLLDEKGQVVWSYNKPPTLPNEFSLTDVASFSRWYLADYPTKTWITDHGLFVLLEPPDSIWKYSVEIKDHHFTLFLWLIPLLLLLNFLVVFVLCRYMTGRWQAERDKARAEWIAAVSHDVRTPLSMVLGYATTLHEDETLNKEQQAQVAVVLQQSKVMRTAIGNINLVNQLDFSTCAQTPFAVAGVVRRVVADTVNADGEGRYRFDLSLVEQVTLKGDEALFARMLQNLIGNAVRHNPNGATIHITMQQKGKHLQLIIADDGVGFPKEVLQGINHHADIDLQKEHGLGLCIAKKIATLHKGRMTCQNDNGAKVVLTFRRSGIRSPIGRLR